jgi:hypothetical protein
VLHCSPWPACGPSPAASWGSGHLLLHPLHLLYLLLLHPLHLLYLLLLLHPLHLLLLLHPLHLLHPLLHLLLLLLLLLLRLRLLLAALCGSAPRRLHPLPQPAGDTRHTSTARNTASETYWSNSKPHANKRCVTVDASFDHTECPSAGHANHCCWRPAAPLL